VVPRDIASTRAAWERAAIIGGHFSWDVTRALESRAGGFDCVTLVNDPIDRMVSYYYERIFHSTRTNLSSLSPARAAELVGALHRTPRGPRSSNQLRDEGAVNTTHKMLCGVRAAASGACSVAMAAARLRSCVVGLSQRHQATCRLFNRCMPWLGMDCATKVHASRRGHESAAEIARKAPGVHSALEALAAPTDRPLYLQALAAFERQEEAAACFPEVPPSKPVDGSSP